MQRTFVGGTMEEVVFCGAEKPVTSTQTPVTSTQKPEISAQTPGTSTQTPVTSTQTPGTSRMPAVRQLRVRLRRMPLLAVRRSVIPLTSLLHVLLVWVLCTSGITRASHVYLNLLEDGEGVTEQHKMAPALDGARPSPSDKLPIEDLLENPDHAFDPSPKDINQRALLRRLGKQLDRDFLSIEEPNDANDSFVYDMKGGRPNGPRPDFLKYLRSFPRADGGQVSLQAGRRQRRRLQKLVWAFTYCPVQYAWKDLGVRFWPRWLREGVCWNGKPCSMPPGMTCKPASSVTKTLLRWHCTRSRPAARRRPDCRWIPVQYPVITQCTCKC